MEQEGKRFIEVVSAPLEAQPETATKGQGVAPLGSPDIESMLQELAGIRNAMVADASLPRALLNGVHQRYRESARNLLHYLVLRRHDLRPLQLRLAALGLSSLGRAESCVLATLEAVIGVVNRLAQRPWVAPQEVAIIDFAQGQRLLVEHTNALLGPPPSGRDVRIMVTMPPEAAQEYTLVHDLLQQGMNCMRVNCAHDDDATWSGMIDNLRRAEKALGRPCQVMIDLAGPKLRTGPLEPGPAVVRIRPQRDIYGRVTAPARIWITSEESPRFPPTPADAILPVSADWISRLHTGEQIRLADARGSKRTLLVADVTEDGCWAEATKTSYIVPGTILRYKGQVTRAMERDARVSALPSLENTLTLNRGDHLVLTRDLKPGRPATLDSEGRVLTPARIGCTIPEVFDKVRSGESIWFDDGIIGGVVEKVETDRVLVHITQALLGGRKLRANKGINLPESELQLGAMTDKDVEDLAFVAQHADVVELSFANSAHDVELLQQHLERLGDRRPGIVLKIETRRGFEHLPEMLLTAMRWPCCGVMIARGDLAVECGFERLAEVQEEILWICEAAHLPVIWATQVLDNLAKVGMPSRAEITDAAMGHRAECVMLNKGPYVVSAVHVLDDILRRMQAHQAKKRAMLRHLRLADGLVVDSVAAMDQSHMPLVTLNETPRTGPSSSRTSVSSQLAEVQRP
jgi:pyruvate kinase